MASEAGVLPENITELHSLIADQKSLIEEKDKTIAELNVRAMTAEQRADLLEEKYDAMVRRHFGRSSEKKNKTEDDKQASLFDEAEVNADEEVVSEKCQTVVKEHARAKRGRKPKDVQLPIKEEIHELADEDRACTTCGSLRPVIGEEETSEIEIVPEHALKIVHIRKKYGPCTCKECSEQGEGGILIAPGPQKIIKGSDFSNRTTAFFLTAKYNDAIPFYRLANILERSGLDITRATLSNHAILAGRAIGDLIDLMKEDLAKSPALLMDETTVQVLKDENKKKGSKSYMWVSRGYCQGNPIHLFSYHPTRSGSFAELLLKNFTGFYVQTDGYQGYNFIAARRDVQHVGCFAHIRRKFVEAHEIAGKTGMAGEAIETIAKLYKIESDLRSKLASNRIDEATFLLRRKSQAEPILISFRDWLMKAALSVTPQSALGKAISYAQAVFPKAARYVEHQLLTPDTNKVENAIRPFVVGRKNWLFSGSPRGAHASAGIYSLIETAKANGHEPYRYLSWLFDRLPACNTLAEKSALLPYRVRPDSIVKLG